MTQEEAQVLYSYCAGLYSTVHKYSVFLFIEIIQLCLFRFESSHWKAFL